MNTLYVCEKHSLFPGLFSSFLQELDAQFIERRKILGKRCCYSAETEWENVGVSLLLGLL